MISRCIALIFAGVSLAACCTSSGGCYAPAPAAGPVAWDGLGPVAAGDGDTDPKPSRRASQKHEIIVGPLNPMVAPSDIQPDTVSRSE
jgi:hypothetical protein